MRDAATAADPPSSPQILLTAAEAFPAFEERFLEARRDISMCFRIFDPFTRLRSEAARRIGRDWFDLLVHTLRRGVTIDLALTDFDPIARPDLHAGTWRSLHALHAVAEASGRPDRLRVAVLMHPARVGWGPRLLFWPLALWELRHTARWLDAMDDRQQEVHLRDRPCLKPLLVRRNGHLRPRFWPPPPIVPGSHHQKLAVFDDDWLYIGGLDLDDRRWDTPRHSRDAEETWHDVQVLMQGPVVARARAHLRGFMRTIEGRATAQDLAPDPDGVFLRTVSRRPLHLPWLSMSPRPVIEELRQAHLDGIEAARDLIYIETQFLRDRRIARALAEAARRVPDLGLVVVLPAAPEDLAFAEGAKMGPKYGEYLQARAVERVTRAFGDRAIIAAAAQPERDASDGRMSLRKAPIIYVHAKVAVFDRTEALISSANLNGRSLSWDTEAGVRLRDDGLPTKVLQRCLRHWMRDRRPDLQAPGLEIVRALRAVMREDAERPPEERQGLLLPYDVRPAQRVGRNMPGIPEELA